MPNLLTIAILIMTLSLTATLRAQPMEMHVISRPDAAALLPVIEPLLPAGGSVQAYRGKLIIRTTAENLRSLQGVLGNLDAEPATVVVHLRRSGSSTGNEQTLEGTVSRNREGDLDAQVQIGAQQSRQQQHDHYQIRTLSGYPARISRGTLLALSNGAYGTQLAALDQGIQVTPQSLPDGHVVLSIQQQHDTVSGNITANTQHSATTLHVTPGQWHPMGSIQIDQSRQQRGIGGSSHQRSTLVLPIEVMVQISE